MSLMTLAEKLGLPIADKPEPELEAAILMNVQALKTENDNLKAEIAKLKGEGDGGEGEGDGGEGGTKPTEPPPVAAGFISMGRENRSMKIDQLVAQRKITPAVAKSLKDQYCTDQAISLSLQPGAKSDSFDGIIAALSLNEPVIALGEKSGRQSLADASKNPLVADAERRAAKAKK